MKQVQSDAGILQLVRLSTSRYRNIFALCVCVCKLIYSPPTPMAGTLTDEEDGEGDEEDEDMGHHIECVQETAVVEDPSVHVVRH